MKRKTCTQLSAICLFTCCFSLPVPFASLAQSSGDEETISYLKNLSIEDLLQTRITSVSKKSESLFSAAAAVTVITQEDIERTGARTIPEALRMVPGLAVANIDASRYAIGSRGFNEYFETKLLVLIDGRSMYTPLFSGVHWGAIDTVMEDIERIEVIRGPGATIWGANAVNGVINIITKSSEDTQGGLVSATVGSHDQPDVSVRYGGMLNDNFSYRIYAKGYNREPNESQDQGDAYDGSESFRTGFRLDSTGTRDDSFSLQAEVYDGEWDGTSMLSGYLTPPYIRITDETETYTGGHILGIWEHCFSDTSTTELQFTYERADRNQVVATELRDTVDIEFKHLWQPLERHDIVWGGGYRWTSDDIDGSFTTTFNPASDTLSLWDIFLQDDINLVEETFWVTIGSKFEYNEYTEMEVQPSIRFRYQPNPDNIIWAAVSYAVRTPSRSETDITINLATIPDGQGGLASRQVLGSDDFQSEKLTAYELGYRWQATEHFLLDVAAFYNDYDNIRSINSGLPYISTEPVTRLVQPDYFANDIKGEAYGAELQASWQPLDNLKLSASYSYIELNLEYTDPSRAETAISSENFAPEHQFQLRSYYNLTPAISLDSELYYVDDIGDDEIDSYVRFDLQLGWQASEQLRLSAGIENLFDSTHQEYFNTQSNIVASEVPRRYWVKAVYSF